MQSHQHNPECKPEWKCVCCGKTIEPAWEAPEHELHQTPPDDATVWHAHGNFGSREFDPITKPEWLELFLCDECLVRHSDRVHHVREVNDKVEIKTFTQYRARNVS